MLLRKIVKLNSDGDFHGKRWAKPLAKLHGPSSTEMVGSWAPSLCCTSPASYSESAAGFDEGRQDDSRAKDFAMCLFCH